MQPAAHRENGHWSHSLPAREYTGMKHVIVPTVMVEYA